MWLLKCRWGTALDSGYGSQFQDQDIGAHTTKDYVISARSSASLTMEEKKKKKSHEEDEEEITGPGHWKSVLDVHGVVELSARPGTG